MKSIFKKLTAALSVLLSVWLIPVYAFAQPETVSDVVVIFIVIIQYLIAILMGASFFLFMIGLAKYVFRSSEEDSRKRGRFIMTWGILALFLLVSIWGVLEIAYDEFGFEDPFGVPTLPTGE